MNRNPSEKYGVGTDEIMDFLKVNMLTKEEAGTFFTKEDAKNFITKEDAKAFVTKEDAKAFATKEDLEKLRLAMADHLDEKLGDLKGDLVILMRKEDHKLINLIELLLNKKVISEKEANNIFKMEPFPKLMIN